MRILDVEVLPVGEELSTPLRWGRFEHRWKGCILVRIRTDNSVYGLGEAGMSLKYRRTISAYVEEVLKPLLLGKDPLQISDLYETMDSVSHKPPCRGIETYAVGGVEIALWDILGKYEKRPLYTLLSSPRRSIQAYWAPSRLELPVLLGAMESALEAGFKGLKLRFAGDTEEDLALLKEVRNAAGPDTAILVDANMSYDLDGVADIGQACANSAVSLLEEPVRATSLGQYAELYAELRRRLPAALPLAGGEGFAAPEDFALMVGRGALDICQPDCVSLGGVGATIEAARIAAAAGRSVIPHISCASVGAVAMSATIHAAMAMENCGWFEYDAHAPESRLRRELFRGVLEPRGGWVDPPSAPGHGVELVESVLEKYLIS